MKAVILVGGKATRLEPLTSNIPKALVPVLNIPFLEHVIRHLVRHRISEIILAQGHLAQSIEGSLGNGNRFGIKLNYVTEDSPRGTAGAIKNTEKYLDETFLVLNGDIFTDLDLTAMLEFHRQRKALVSIALSPVDDPTAYGLIETDEDSRITRFLEKPKPEEVTTNMINAGTYIIEHGVLARIPAEKSVSIERETYPQLLASEEPIYAYPSTAYWIDIGTPEKYLQLHRNLLADKYQGYSFSPDEAALIGRNSLIHPTAQITRPVLIGGDCYIGRGVKLTGPVVIGNGCNIEENCVVEDSVIWRDNHLEPAVNLKNCIIANNCHLGQNSAAEGVVLGEEVSIKSGTKLQPGSRVEPGKNL